MEYRIKEWNPTTGAEVRTLGYLKSVNYQAQCNEASDLRYGALLNEVLTVEVFSSSETQLTRGAWVSFEVKNNPAADDDSRTAGWTDTEWTFYGIYKVDGVEDGRGFYTFTAYPSTRDLNVDYSDRLKYLVDSGAFPMQMEDLVADACSLIGLSFNKGTTGQSLAWSRLLHEFYSNGVTVKDIVCAAAEIIGAYARDAFGYTNSYPASPISTQRGIIMQEYALRENTKPDNSTGYYLIAPTDAAVDTSAFSGTLFSNVYYKENGFKAGNAINPVTKLEIVSPNGSKITYTYFSDPPENTYRISNNIMANNTYLVVGGSIPYAAIQNALGNPLMRPATIRLFPFNCPFRCGDKANVTNGNGISFQMPIMSLVINDSEAVLSCSGNELYQTAQNQYSTADQSTQSNSIEIGKVRSNLDALDAFARGAILTASISASGGESRSYSVANTTRFVLVTSTAQDTGKGMYIFAVSNAGAVSYVAIRNASDISFTTGINTLTITSSRVVSFGFFVFNGSVEQI